MKKLIVLMLFYVLLTISAYSATINVPADYPTIEDGIDAAVDGDTVLVAPGTYYESAIGIYQKTVHLVSSDGPEATIIDGENYSTILVFEGWKVLGSTVEGFTFVNGGASGNFNGGGIRCTDCGIYIRNNIFTDCGAAAVGYGGGIRCSDASPIIEYNLFCNNFAKFGGGIDCTGDDSAPRIRFNTFCNNTVGKPGYSGDGGAISLTLDCHGVIHDNLMANNMAYSNGGAIYAYRAHADIARNIIVDNWAEGFGGGIYISTYPQLTIADNIISGNEAESGGGILLSSCFNPDPVVINNTLYNNRAYSSGGGMWLSQVQATIENTILWDNEAPEGNELYIRDYPSQDIGIDYSNVKGGLESVLLTGYDPELTWGAHMIDADPLFVDPSAYDFHLTYDSPCRDSGNESVVNHATDHEGDSRIAYGLVDMGADEFYNHLYCTGDFIPNGDITGKFVGLPGSTPIGLFIGSGILDPPLQHAWGEFHLESPWMLVPLVPIPADGVLKIPTTLPAAPAPYDIPMQALIGWELSNLFVLPVR